MKIPEAYICDAEGCPKDAVFRLTHGLIHPDFRSAYSKLITFTFCEEHAGEFDIGGRGGWTGPKLRQGAPE